MKSTSTNFEPVYIGSLIWPLGITVSFSKLTRGESYAVRSSDFKFSLLYRSGYIISIALPWFTNTLFTSYPLSWVWPSKYRHGVGWFRSYLRLRSLEPVRFLFWLFLAPNCCPRWTAEPQTSLWRDKNQSYQEQQRWHWSFPEEVLKKHLFRNPNLSAPPGH